MPDRGRGGPRRVCRRRRRPVAGDARRLEDFGATWDEPQQRAKGQHLLAYLTGASPVLIDPIDGAHLYGAPLDLAVLPRSNGC